MTSAGWQPLVKDLMEALVTIGPKLARVGLQEQADDIGVLIDVGEYGLAIEQLWSHLTEFALPVTKTELELITASVTSLGMEKYLWEDLIPRLEKDEIPSITI